MSPYHTHFEKKDYTTYAIIDGSGMLMQMLSDLHITFTGENTKFVVTSGNEFEVVTHFSSILQFLA